MAFLGIVELDADAFKSANGKADGKAFALFQRLVATIASYPDKISSMACRRNRRLTRLSGSISSRGTARQPRFSTPAPFATPLSRPHSSSRSAGSSATPSSAAPPTSIRSYGTPPSRARTGSSGTPCGVLRWQAGSVTASGCLNSATAAPTARAPRYRSSSPRTSSTAQIASQSRLD